GLTAAEQARFEAGQEDFEEIEEVDDGLGPVFNDAGWAGGHPNPGGGTNGRLETRFGKWRNGQFDPLANLGGSLLQDKAIGSVPTGRGFFTFVAEVVPGNANAR